jgi:hypothetical protein
MRRGFVKRRIKVLTLLLFVSLVAYSGNLMAKGKTGRDLVVTKIGGEQVKGELIAVRQRSLLLMDWQTRGDVSIQIKEVRNIKYTEESHLLRGGLLGLLAGVALGAVASAAWLEKNDSHKTAVVLKLSGTFGGLGGLIGATVGQATSPINIIQIEGKGEAEINAILGDLRSMARVPDAQ